VISTLSLHDALPILGYGKMEGEGDDKLIAYMIERDECQGPIYYQKWYGMKPTTPIISGGMNALRLPGFFENLGHGNVINTAGGRSEEHTSELQSREK